MNILCAVDIPFLRDSSASLLRLGPLERAVLDELWTRTQSCDVASLHAAVGGPRGLSRNTTQSTLERLVRKGLVSRGRVGRAYFYATTISRARWIGEMIEAIASQLGADDHQAVLVGLVDFAERTGEESLVELEALVRKRRLEGEGDE